MSMTALLLLPLNAELKGAPAKRVPEIWNYVITKRMYWMGKLKSLI